MYSNVLINQQDLSEPVESHYHSTEIRYKIFVSIWAISTLFHMATNRMFTIEFHYFLLSAAAVYLMFKPSSIIRLLVFIALQLYEVFNALPMGSNHWIFAAFVNLTILHALIYLVLKHKSFRIDRVEFLETLAPIVRIELIILYFFVVFHKLNSDFFTTEVSCASDFYVAQNAYSILPSTTDILALNAYLTVFVEALIPILLCIRRTRNWGLLIGLVFHCVIAYNPINGFYDFSSVIFALYFLFTSYRFSNKLYNVYKATYSRKFFIKAQLPSFSYLKLGMFLLVFLAGVAVVHVLTTGFKDYFRHVIWTAFSFGFIAIFITAMLTRDTKTGASDKAFSIAHASLLIIPILVFFNGICPYLGLKTESSFAMFSNLRTEGGISNHLIVPASVQIFDYQKELVQIKSSSDKVLKKYVRQNKMVVYPHFQRIISMRKPANVTYVYKGQEKTFSMASAAPGDPLLEQQPYWFRKLIRFRPISEKLPQPCAH
ncbi:hypothetical protein [Cesiribacter sp. SM1]|uniref:hypothetical protein n=1 Tax=Cesiribacter sp. SM1 TaxID=2861196 RepID=UPI001CD20A40|nr:hypothetical protein [Cesiribacter sp. SM1]